MTVRDIPLEKILTIDSIANRTSDSSIVNSESFLQLRESIKRFKTLIHPVTVVKEDKGYVLLSGKRRYLSYKSLLETEGGEYAKIPAVIKESDNPIEVDEFITSFHENNFRKNLDNYENIEAIVSAIPFFFGVGVKNKKADNIEKGFDILTLAKRFEYYRSTGNDHQHKTLERLKKETSCLEPLVVIDDIFNNIELSAAEFYRKTKALKFKEPIKNLYREKFVSLKIAAKLNRGVINAEEKKEDEKKKKLERLVEEIPDSSWSRKIIDEKINMIISANTSSNFSKGIESRFKSIKGALMSVVIEEDDSIQINTALDKIEKILNKKGKK